MRKLFLAKMVLLLASCGISPSALTGGSDSRKGTADYTDYVELSTALDLAPLKSSEFSSVGSQLCDNTVSDYDTLASMLYAISDGETEFTESIQEKAAVVYVTCPDKLADLDSGFSQSTQGQLDTNFENLMANLDKETR